MMRRLTTLDALERAYVVLSFAILGGAFLPIIDYFLGVQNRGEGLDSGSYAGPAAAIFVLTTTAIYFAAAVAFAWRRRTWPVLYSNWCMNALVLLAFASTLWSDEPLLTLRRAVALTGTMVFGYYLVARFTVGEMIRLIAASFALVLIASVVLFAVSPDAATMVAPHEGAWRGVYMHKNGLGSSSALACITFLYLAAIEPRRRIVYGALTLLSLLLVVLSDSATAITLLAAVCVIMSIMLVLRRVAFALLPALALVLLVGSLVGYLMWEPLLLALGRDATFTGRTDIWGLTLDALSDNVWLGSGYGVFWEPSNPHASYIWAILDWEFTHAHNGFIELALELGAVGGALVVAALCLALGRCLIAFRDQVMAHAAYLFALLIFFLVQNISESELVRYADFGWVMVVWASSALIRYVEVARAGSAEPLAAMFGSGSRRAPMIRLEGSA